MDLDTRGTGRTTRRMAEAGSYMQMETFTKGSGRMTKVRDMESTCTLTALSTRASGLKTNRRDMDWRHGQMEPSMRADTRTG